MTSASTPHLNNIDRNLNASNIQHSISNYLQLLKNMKFSLDESNVYNLLKSLKRAPLATGPYAGVSAFEASNRIMTDLTILYGIQSAFKHPRLTQFKEYTVEFGNENKNLHDILSSNGSQNLFGEAFNVAPSFFHPKKSATLKKLRENKSENDILLILYNSDARTSVNPIAAEPNEIFIAVDIEL